jgi:D-alanyl-D-alanine carboxypeptidase
MNTFAPPRAWRTAACIAMLVFASSAAPVCAQALQSQIDAIFNSLPSHTLSGLVLSADGTVLYYASNPDTGRKPASVTKTFTVGTSLALLGSDHQFVTRVLRDGAIDANGVLQGDLILLGQHDFTWATDYYPGNARFALDRIAVQLYANGLRGITGTVRGFGYLMYAETPSNLDAVNAFRDALLAAGISVSATATSTSFSPPGVPMLEWRSMPLASACRDLLKVSDNEDAEATMRHLAWTLAGSSSAAVGEDIVQAFLAAQGVDMTGSIFLDGSGLSHSNRASARQAIGVTRTLLGRQEGWNYAAMLPIGGIDGTLGGRFTSGPAYGRVHAKTGSLTGVITLSGYVSNPIDNERYDFAFLMNDTTFVDADARGAIDDAVELLTGDLRTSSGLVPAAPTLRTVVADPASGTATLGWTASSGATSYRVEVSTTGTAWSTETTVAGLTAVVAGLTPDKASSYRVRAVGPGGTSASSDAYGVRAVANAPRVLIVDGNDRWVTQTENAEAANHEFALRIGEALSQLVGFDSVANEAVTGNLVALADYDAVFWMLGEESTAHSTFDVTEQARVAAYLNGGGNLFVSGAEIGWDLVATGNTADAAFYSGLLKATYVADASGTEEVMPAGGIFADLPADHFSFHPGWMSVDYADVLAPAGGAIANLRYLAETGGDAGVAGIQYAGAYRVVHWGFPIETIAHTPTRRALVNRVLGYFLDAAYPDDAIIEVRDLTGTQLGSPTYAESGAWTSSSVKSNANDLRGTGSRFMDYSLPNTGTDSATFVPDVAVTAWYDVYATWGLGANAYSVRYTIRHADGVDVRLVHQIPYGVAGANANTWVHLGRYRFLATQNAAVGSIEVSEATVTGRPSATWNQRVYADAIKLSLVARPLPSAGDWDLDGDVDLSDYELFADCLAGPAQAPHPAKSNVTPAGCLAAFDFDDDGDVDLRDAVKFGLQANR